jgi:hypothetical protein
MTAHPHSTAALALLGVVALCAYTTVALRQDPPDTWLAYALVFAAAAVAFLAVVATLFRPRHGRA